MRKFSIFMCAALLVLASAAASEVSAGQGWFTGFSAGQASWGSYTDEMEGFDIEFLDDSDLGYVAFGGYQIHTHFGVVAGYADLGELSARGTFDGTSDGFTDTLDASGFFTAAMAIYPVNDRFTLFASAGIFRWDMDYVWTELGETFAGGDSGTGAMFGAGANFWLNGKQNSGIHVEWDRFNGVGNLDVIGHEVDIDLISAGWVYRFGR